MLLNQNPFALMFESVSLHPSGCLVVLFVPQNGSSAGVALCGNCVPKPSLQSYNS